MKNKKIKYQFNWCDYFTQCPHNKDIMVGDYYCTQCQYFIDNKITKHIKADNFYFSVAEGYVYCSKTK